MPDTNRLTELYEVLVTGKNKIDIENWHRNYVDIVTMISEIKKGKDRQQLLEYFKGEANKIKDNAKDKEETLLWRLFREKNNGVASRGQGVIHKHEEKSPDQLCVDAVNDNDFLGKLTNLMKEPTNPDNYKEFLTKWNNVFKQNNPLIINRIVAGCAPGNVSAVCNEIDFNIVFDWLVKENLIELGAVVSEDNWLKKNLHLMGQIKNIINFPSEYNDDYYKSIFIWQLVKFAKAEKEITSQTIMYGPPGTGKTYQARQLASDRIWIWRQFLGAPKETNISNYTEKELIRFVQFHPSFSYEDFIEGLRPTKNGNLELTNGIFKAFCKEAARWEIDYYEAIKSNTDSKTWAKATIEDVKKLSARLTGEYWNYIWAIGDKTKFISEVVPPYFFLIDEINRAELSRVFGELMYCLEYRGVEGRVSTQYAQLNTETTGLLNVGTKEKPEYQFFIPHNVHIIGTMNNIDRSVESFDFALRRRFRWEEVLPNSDVLRNYLANEMKLAEDKVNTIIENWEKLNEKIKGETGLLGADYQIGHAYLMNLDEYIDNVSRKGAKKICETLWDERIKPLLQEYLRGSGKDNLLEELKKAFLPQNDVAAGEREETEGQSTSSN